MVKEAFGQSNIATFVSLIGIQLKPHHYYYQISMRNHMKSAGCFNSLRETDIEEIIKRENVSENDIINFTDPSKDQEVIDSMTENKI